MDTLKDFFKDEHKRRMEEAAGIMPLGMHVVDMIEKQQAVRRKTRWYWWFSGSIAFVLAAVGAGFYFRDFLAVFFRWAGETSGVVTGRLVEVYQNIKISLLSWGTGVTQTAESGFIEKATTEISAWPVQVWYVIFLVAGVALLLGVDTLVRHRKFA